MSDFKLNSLIGKSISDIILLGSVDLDETPIESCINHEFLVLGVDDTYIEFSSVNQMSELSVKEKDALTFDYEIDEDDKHTFVSIVNAILADTVSDAAIKELSEYEEAGSLVAIEVLLANGQMIFIDPTYYTGIKIGGEFIKKAFFDNHSEAIKR